jgi:hypothetical protein
LRNFHSIRHGRANGRERNFVSHSHVESSTTHLQWNAISTVYIYDLDPISFGVRSQSDYFGNNNSIDQLDNRHLFDGHAKVAHLITQLNGVTLDWGELTQPGKKYFHQKPVLELTQKANIIGVHIS